MTNKILVIDDDASLQILLTERIRDFGGKPDCVEYAHSGEEGIEKYKDIMPVFTFLDVRMTGISGAETFEMILAFDEDANVFVVSGYADSPTTDAIKLGAKGYISKSADYISMMASLVVAVEKAMKNK